MIRKIAIDLDGVVVDFLRGAYSAGIFDPETGRMDEAKLLEADERFWADLPAIVEGLWLYSRLYAFSRKKDLTIYILSHAINEASKAGKREWIQKNLKTNPMEIVFVAKRKDKNDFADSQTLLIDDYQKNCDEFEAAGGHSVCFHRQDFKKTLEDLRAYLREI
jgi:phosphoglycolate phosphatase-like HAD superfamily hydrolase